MHQFWSSLESVLERGESAFAAFVVDHTRHSPGTSGAKLFVSSSGVSVGTIGGGAMEQRVLSRARRVLREGQPFAPELQTLVHRREPGPGIASGMICAGEQTNLYAFFEPSDQPFVSDVADLLAHDRPGRIRVSAEGWSLDRGTPSPEEPRVILRRDEEAWYVEEQVLVRRRVAIFGGGHCGLALSRVLETLGCVVTVVDVRQDVATLDENHYARYIHVVDDYRRGAGSVRYPGLSAAIVMTADYPSDVRALLGIYDASPAFRFVGLMGAKAKIRAIYKDLADHGVDAEFLGRIVAPVGVAMKSDTPEEIAISVAAQLLQLESF